jgi:hypothetical protein
MIRRPPTRIEMKLEDIHEYEKAKKEADAKRAKAAMAAAAASSADGGQSTSSAQAAAAAPKTRKEMIQDRIGFHPGPKPTS